MFGGTGRWICFPPLDDARRPNRPCWKLRESNQGHQMAPGSLGRGAASSCCRQRGRQREAAAAAFPAPNTPRPPLPFLQAPCLLRRRAGWCTWAICPTISVSARSRTCSARCATTGEALGPPLLGLAPAARTRLACSRTRLHGWLWHATVGVAELVFIPGLPSCPRAPPPPPACSMARCCPST